MQELVDSIPDVGALHPETQPHYAKMKKDWQEIVENINRDPSHMKLRDHFRDTTNIPDDLLQMRLG